jgi:uncharacterized protein (TIGR02757 family)
VIRGRPLARALENLYSCYNRRDLVEPDPLQFLYRYARVEDRELAGLVASGLAYGRVEQILKSTRRVLDLLGPSPSAFLAGAPLSRLVDLLSGFRHRFTPGAEIAAVLHAVSLMQEECGGSIEGFFSDRRALHSAEHFVCEVLGRSRLDSCSLLPRPSAGSACKRLNLFLRWMVRCDEVDPGGWTCMSPADLLVPLDVHMHRAGVALGMTSRVQGDLRTVLEITEGFRTIRPDDPARYDFSITRFGIRRELTLGGLMEFLDASCALGGAGGGSPGAPSG